MDVLRIIALGLSCFSLGIALCNLLYQIAIYKYERTDKIDKKDSDERR